jgi:hypothetical protein
MRSQQLKKIPPSIIFNLHRFRILSNCVIEWMEETKKYVCFRSKFRFLVIAPGFLPEFLSKVEVRKGKYDLALFF